MKNSQTIGKSFLQLIYCLGEFCYPFVKALFWVSLFGLDLIPFLENGFLFSIYFIGIFWVLRFLLQPVEQKILTIIKLGLLYIALQSMGLLPIWSSKRTSMYFKRSFCYLQFNLNGNKKSLRRGFLKMRFSSFNFLDQDIWNRLRVFRQRISLIRLSHRTYW